MFEFLKRRLSPAPTLEEQLQRLGDCGIGLAEECTVDDLLQLSSRSAIEKQPYLHLLYILGNEGAPASYLSNDIWHFDTECIEDHGDYARIIQRMSELTKGALPVRDVRDHVDLDAGQAWVAFILGRQEYRWKAEVDDDWVDAEIITRLVALLDAQGQGRRFIAIDLLGQDMLIGCATADEFDKLNRLLGSRARWLS